MTLASTYNLLKRGTQVRIKDASHVTLHYRSLLGRVGWVDNVWIGRNSIEYRVRFSSRRAVWFDSSQIEPI
jgi:hypothetical protein